VGEGAIVDQRVGLDRRGGHLRRGCVCAWVLLSLLAGAWMDMWSSTDGGSMVHLCRACPSVAFLARRHRGEMTQSHIVPCYAAPRHLEVKM
jgi:hypothetical protein